MAEQEPNVSGGGEQAPAPSGGGTITIKIPDKKILAVGAAVIILLIIVVSAAASGSSSGKKIKVLEQKIEAISDVYESEDEIISLYGEYNQLSSSEKEKLGGGEKLENAYTQIKAANQTAADIEERVFAISDVYEEEREIAALYKEYEALPSSFKKKISNREKLMDSYTQIEAIIQQRTAEASAVDEAIAAIDYSNIYAQADSVVAAAVAFNSIDEKTQEYVNRLDELLSAYNDVKDLNISVTYDNLFELFNVQYKVGSKLNYGEGLTSYVSGYNVDVNGTNGKITPNYDYDANYDFATPVYIYVSPKYPNLYSSCSFYINLHQTYNGLGIIDSDVHEFALQSANIKYNYSMGVGEYLINVEDNDASGGLLDLFGFSYDWSDRFHEMNPFDVSRVEFGKISGSVSYPN